VVEPGSVDGKSFMLSFVLSSKPTSPKISNTH
jgi:hypothetical protein